MKTINITLILVLSILPLCAEDAETESKLPSGAERVVKYYERDLAKAREDYLQEVQKINDRALRDLEREQEKTVKSGDLEAALAVKAKIDEISASTTTDFLGNTIEVTSTSNDTKTTNLVNGLIPMNVKLTSGNEWFIFKENGVLETQYGIGDWKVDEGKILGRWRRKLVSHTFSKEGEGFKYTTPNGRLVKLTIQK